MRTLLFVLLVAGIACSKQEPPAPTATPAPSAAPSVASAAPSAEPPAPVASAATGDGDVPVEEDFEDEATQKVTATTLDSQLDALEKEIQSD